MPYPRHVKPPFGPPFSAASRFLSVPHIPAVCRWLCAANNSGTACPCVPPSYAELPVKGTVLDNILYGQVKKKLKDVEELIKKLGFQEYISRLPKGLATEVIQNNSGVSAGQAQVIAFIRAILSNKDVIILDEPISNVDAETRDLILGVLMNKDFDRTLIIVSHVIEGMDFINRVIEI